MRRLINAPVGALAIAVAVAIAFLLAACPTASGGGGNGSGGTTTYPYVCDNGTSTSGMTDRENVQNCSACDSTYRLVNRLCNTRTMYTCTGGTARDGMPDGTADVELCESCTSGNPPVSGLCASSFAYICTNGTPDTRMSSMPNVELCSACNSGFKRVPIGLTGAVCNPTQFTCQNGVAQSGSTTTNNDEMDCSSCNPLFTLSSGGRPRTCQAGTLAVGAAMRIGSATQFNAALAPGPAFFPESTPTGLAALSGTLYMVGHRNRVIFTVSTATGVADSFGTRGFGVGEFRPNGLAAIGTTLYMVGWTNDVLYSVDTTSGSVTRIGMATKFDVTEDTPTDLAAMGTTLYMLGTNGTPGGATSGAYLYTLNTTTGVATRRGNTAAGFGVSESTPTGLAAIDNTLYMVGQSNDVLYTLNTTTGSATRVGMATNFEVFDVTEDAPAGLAAIGSTLYMVGQSNAALYVLRYQ